MWSERPPCKSSSSLKVSSSSSPGALFAISNTRTPEASERVLRCYLSNPAQSNPIFFDAQNMSSLFLIKIKKTLMTVSQGHFTFPLHFLLCAQCRRLEGVILRIAPYHLLILSCMMTMAPSFQVPDLRVWWCLARKFSLSFGGILCKDFKLCSDGIAHLPSFLVIQQDTDDIALKTLVVYSISFMDFHMRHWMARAFFTFFWEFFSSLIRSLFLMILFPKKICVKLLSFLSSSFSSLLMYTKWCINLSL